MDKHRPGLERAVGRYLQTWYAHKHIHHARRLRDACAAVAAAYPALEAEAAQRFVSTGELPTAALDAFNAALQKVSDEIEQLDKSTTIGELAVMLLGDEIDPRRKPIN